MGYATNILVNGKRAYTEETTRLLAKELGITWAFRMKPQTAYDLYEVKIWA